jgi:hypothetical protein
VIFAGQAGAFGRYRFLKYLYEDVVFAAENLFDIAGFGYLGMIFMSFSVRLSGLLLPDRCIWPRYETQD